MPKDAQYVITADDAGLTVTPLDGGRVLSLLSKWFNVAGLAVAAGLLLYEISAGNTVSPVLFLVLIFGAFSTFQRFRSTALNPAYYAVDAQTKLANAQSAEISAVTDYQISQVDIAFATGTVLGASKVVWQPATLKK